MTNRRSTLLTFAAAALVSLLLPVMASAQNRPWWDRGGDRRDDDYYGRRSGRISDSERRTLRDVARRIDSRSKDFQKDVDRLLDNSRYDDTRREDRINDLARDFRNAAARFRDRAGDSNDLNRSEGEARQLLDSASRINRVVSRVRLDSRTASEWSQISSDLRTVANIYGLRYSDYGGGYGNGRDDDYGRDRNRDRNNRGNNRGWRWPRNIPNPF